MPTRTSYPSDLADAQWHKIATHFPADAPCASERPNKGGRPRQYSSREIVNALFHQARSGCAWRLLPPDFPPHGSVWGYFRQWRDDGTLTRLHDALRGQVREQAGKEPTPSAMIVDSKTVTTTKIALARVQETYVRLARIWADGGYSGTLIAWVQATCGVILAIVKRCDDVKGFEVLPHRWIVERTFGWLGRYRRLSKDYEYLPKSSEAWIRVAMIHIMVRKLTRE